MGPSSAVLEQALLFGVAPLWILAGTADFACHRLLLIGGWMLSNVPQTLALFGAGDVAPGWNFQSRQAPLPGGYLLGFIVASALLVTGPFLYELWR